MSRPVRRIEIPVYESQIQRVHRAISRGHLVTGPDLDELEDVIRQRSGRRHVILVSSGFAALVAASRLVPTTQGSVVSIPVSTCFAIPNAVRVNNRDIRFVDADLRSMGTPAVVPRHDDALIIAPDHFGTPSPIVNAPAEPPVPIIHDAAQSFFSIHAGHARVAKATTLSFYPSKLANGIDGGAVLIDDDELAIRIRRFCSYHEQGHPERELRMNLRMANVHAAFLLGTLEHAQEIQNLMTRIFHRLASAARKCGLRVPMPTDTSIPTRFVAMAPSELERNAIVRRMQRGGVEACLEFIWLCDAGLSYRYSAADTLVRTTFSLPLHPCLTEEDVCAMERLLA